MTSASAKTILLLEDDKRLARAWQNALEELGYRVLCEYVAENAIQAVNQHRIDLAIMDMLIRDGDGKLRPRGGLSLLTHIRLRIEPSPPVICVTGSDPELEIGKHAQALRANRVLKKPIPLADLLEAVRQLLDKPALADERIQSGRESPLP